MKKLAILLSVLVTSAAAWAGSGTLILQGSLGNGYLGQQINPSFQLIIPINPAVTEYHRPQRPWPRPDYGQWHRPPSVIHQYPHAVCPLGTREFFNRAWDAYGNVYYVFQGCR
jgi:hypothetical protein